MWWNNQKIKEQYRRWLTPRFKSTPMFLALMIWLCALPLLALVATPFLGWKITAYLAGFLLVADTVVCWFLCKVHMPQSPAICDKCLKRLNAQGWHATGP